MKKVYLVIIETPSGDGEIKIKAYGNRAKALKEGERLNDFGYATQVATVAVQ